MPTISAKPVGVGVAPQRLVPTDERSGLQMQHRVDGKRFVVHADGKLSAFVELESGIADASGWLQQLGQMTRVQSRSSMKLCACVTSRNSSGVR